MRFENARGFRGRRLPLRPRGGELQPRPQDPAVRAAGSPRDQALADAVTSEMITEASRA